MTVHRVGPGAPGPPQQYRADLGRLLVTIDDLAALITFLTRSTTDHHERLSTKVSVEFDGGIFTDAEDLRTLSDIEMRNLRLKSPKVLVVLNPTDVFVVGDRHEADDVYRLWARARQTSLRPRPIRLSDNLKYIPILVGGPLGVLPISILLLGDTSSDAPPSSVVIGAAAGALAVIFLTCAFMWRNDRARESSYAVVVPLSLTEHRQSRSSQIYPRRSWIVAIVAAIIAAAAVGVAIWAVLGR